MNILITGGCGFIGSSLAVALRSDGHDIICFDNLSRRGSEVILNRILDHGCKFIHGDIRNREDFNKIKQQCEIMIECSAEPSVLVGSQGAEAMFMVENNLYGAINCFEYSRMHDIGIIFVSTSRVYPYDVLNSFRYEEKETRYEYCDQQVGISRDGIRVDFPLQGFRSLYGATKLSAEYVLREYSLNYNIPCLINRCGVVAGPWQLGKADQGVFTYWLLNYYFKKNLQYIGFGGKGKQVRDLLHISDLCRLITFQIKAISKYRGEVFNAGGGRKSNLSLRETTDLCEQITGNNLEIVPILSDRPADVLWYITDNSKTVQEFKWTIDKEPTAILTDTYAWLLENERILKNIFKG
ncbi:MAG: NAD-dependent epimerase/dehydratase family protein [Bacteroidota bacterium]|jgi:CDP-paratose 2-epimerase